MQGRQSQTVPYETFHNKVSGLLQHFITTIHLKGRDYTLTKGTEW